MRVGDDVSANQGAGTGVGVRSLVDAWGTQLAPPTSNLAQPHRVVDDHRQAGRWVGVRFDPMVTPARARSTPYPADEGRYFTAGISRPCRRRPLVFLRIHTPTFLCSHAFAIAPSVMSQCESIPAKFRSFAAVLVLCLVGTDARESKSSGRPTKVTPSNVPDIRQDADSE